MGNHNVLITNPKGEKRLQFSEDTSRWSCKKWLEEYGPAPIGWFYQIINNNKNKRKHPLYTILKGLDIEGEVVDIRKARIKLNNNSWYTLRRAKRDSKRLGSITFKREKIWEE